MNAAGPFGQPPHPGSFHGRVTVHVHPQRARLAGVLRREGVRADDAPDCVEETFLSFLNLPRAGRASARFMARGGQGPQIGLFSRPNW